MQMLLRLRLVLMVIVLTFARASATRSKFLQIPFVTAAFQEASSSEIPVNYARLTFSLIQNESQPNAVVTILGQTSACYECDLLPLGEVTAAELPFWTTDVPSPFPFRFSVALGNASSAAMLEYWFGERGVYNVHVDFTTSPPSLRVDTVEEPEAIYIPLLAAAGICGVILGVLHFLPAMLRGPWWSALGDSSKQSINANERTLFLEHETKEDGPKGKAPLIRGKVRYPSLDTFRGLSLSIMVFVNQGGGWYWWLNHSFWNGLTVADLVFPWFIFMMGTSLAIVLRSAARRGETLAAVLLRALRRSAILFCFGLLVAMPNYPDDRPQTTNLGTLRIPGVLQRFAVSYLAVTLIAYGLSPHEGATPEYDPSEVDDTLASFMRSLCQFDFLHYKQQWLVVAVVQAAWLLLTFCLKVPGWYLGPGGLSEHGRYFNCTGGAARYIDYTVLGVEHMYQHGTFQPVYHPAVHHDPEGILGYLTSITLCFLGLMAGRILLNNSPSHAVVIKRLFLYGALLCLVAGCLCNFSQNGGVIPLCKNLWSLSFIFCMGGFAMVILGVLHYVVDVKQWWSGSPFVYPGMNSIAVYMISEIMSGYFPLSFNPPGGRSSHAWMLTQNLTAVGSLMLFAFWLDHVKFYLAV
jgi:heparan-alpha-glucosaminide N-acetyltransferase